MDKSFPSGDLSGKTMTTDTPIKESQDHKIGDVVLVPCVVTNKGNLVYTLEKILDLEVVSAPGVKFSIFSRDVE